RGGAPSRRRAAAADCLARCAHAGDGTLDSCQNRIDDGLLYAALPRIGARPRAWDHRGGREYSVRDPVARGSRAIGFQSMSRLRTTSTNLSSANADAASVVTSG